MLERIDKEEGRSSNLYFDIMALNQPHLSFLIVILNVAQNLQPSLFLDFFLFLYERADYGALEICYTQ